MFKTLLLLSAVLISVHHATAATDKVVCFFASWAGYRTGQGSFKPADVNAKLCTHVLYAFLGVNPDGSLAILDSWNEIDLHGLEYIDALKSSNPSLKVLISIGGYNAGNALLNSVAASKTLRTNLISSALAFFQQWDYDGIDIDWEYPVNSDKANFVTLLEEMKASFNAYGYILSVTVTGIPLSSYDIPNISKYVDLINVMTYDFTIPTDGVTGFNSPLYGSSSVNSSIQSYLALGAPASKLTLSVPFYGHTFTLSSPSNPVAGVRATPGIAGPFTQSPGTIGYNEICAYYGDYTTVFDPVAQVPYSYSGSNWISFDNPQSVALKTRYAKSNGLAGVAIWSVDTDDFTGVCGTQDGLLQAIHTAIIG